MSGSEPDLLALLAAHGGRLRGFVRSEGAGLLRFESEDDLIQGIHARALQGAGHFEWRGAEAFAGWLFAVARQHFADRQRHWLALRRDGGQLLRITQTPATEGGRGIDPSASMTGPYTFAERKEQLALAAKALALLAERDRKLVQWLGEDLSLEETAARLGVNYEAAKRARQRALERFKQTFALLTRPNA